MCQCPLSGQRVNLSVSIEIWRHFISMNERGHKLSSKRLSLFVLGASFVTSQTLLHFTWSRTLPAWRHTIYMSRFLALCIFIVYICVVRKFEFDKEGTAPGEISMLLIWCYKAGMMDVRFGVCENKMGYCCNILSIIYWKKIWNQSWLITFCDLKLIGWIIDCN